MIPVFATNLFAPATSSLLMAASLPVGEVSTTLYLSDTQFEHLGPRTFTRNPLIKKYSPVADRNVIATQTAGPFVDTLLRHNERRFAGENLSLQILGDIPDTPCQEELNRFEQILANHAVPVEGYDRGNHSSSNAFGVINLKSRLYEFLRRYVPFFHGFSLRQEICKACGSASTMLTAQETLQGMHRILHRHRSATPGVEAINRSVHRANYEGYELTTGQPVPFDEAHRRQNFETFWSPSPATQRGDASEAPFWEAMVNHEVANDDVAERPTDVNPFYIQAAETVRFQLGGGAEVPVYTLSLDSVDTANMIATRPGISELQIRLIETFIEEKLAENPNARFKVSCHFSASSMLNRSVTRRARRAFKKLLARDEIILFTSGHDHYRKIVDLNKELRLKRATPLPAVIVPSLIDFHPVEKDGVIQEQDARAILVERMWVERDPEGKGLLKLDLCYKGLDPDELQRRATPAVRRELALYEEEHGYMRSKETAKQLKSRHVVGFTKGQFKRAWEFFTVGFNIFRPRRFVEYWRGFSISQYIIDNFTVVSTVNMFNEAFHLIPFLDSLSRLVATDGDPAEKAIQNQIEGLRTALSENHRERLHAFEKALGEGQRASELRQYNDLFEQSGTYLLSKLLLALNPEGQARTFAVMAGLAASRAEFEFHRHSVSQVPSQLPLQTIPLGVLIAVGEAVGTPPPNRPG